MSLTRLDCLALDAADELAAHRERFALPPGDIYLDGNSLGALPHHVPARMQAVMQDEWGRGLIRSWNDAAWISVPARVGAKIARLIGADADADEVMVADSTSANLFKQLVLALRLNPGRRVILTERLNFPTNLYIAQGVAELLGAEIRYVDSDPAAVLEALDKSVAVLSLTHVNFKTGRIYPMREITAKAHQVGALALWDLCHSAGTLALDLHDAEVDLAVGCGYKYLNGGPGAPAFVYVARQHQDRASQPLSGWHGHARPFEFVTEYQPAAGIERMQCGTPPLLSMLALESALEVFDDVDMQTLRRKGQQLTDLFIRLADEQLARHGIAVASPRAADERGSQVALTHPQGYAIMQALIARGVIGDFRAPDILRFGFAPLYVRFVDMFDAIHTLAEIMATQAWNQPSFLARKAVT